MAYYQFIDFTYLTDCSIIPKNVDAGLISKFIRQAQDMNLQQALGHDLYFKLMNDFATTDTTTGDYLTLMNDFVKPAQTEWTTYHALPFIHQRITNQSLVKNGGDNSTPVDLKEMQALREEIRNSAEYYTERIREFILNNQNSFPEYFTTNGVNRIQPKQTSYNSGIYTGSSLNNRRNYGNDGYNGYYR